MTRILPAWLSPHRAVLLGLILLAICAFGVSAGSEDFGHGVDGLALTLILSILVTGAVTYLCAAVVRVPPNSDSWLISALILWFVMPTGTGTPYIATIVLAAAVTAASKYVLAWRRRLILNPVVAGALAAYICAYAGVPNVMFPVWWVAAQELLIPMVLIGIVVVSALRDWPLVLTFLAASLITLAVVEAVRGGQSITEWATSIPTFFAVTFMIPEPLTSPRHRVHRLIYGAGLGVLMYCGVQVQVSDSYVFSFIPEIALAIGCLYAFAVRLAPGGTGHRRFPVEVSSVTPIAEQTTALTLTGGRDWQFRPGQWALLADPRWTDSVGRRSRRVFSFASPPDRRSADFGFTVADAPSPFKRRLLFGETERLWVDDVAGEFVLPRSADGRRIELLAAGIGITPFAAMLTDAVDRGEDLAGIRLTHVVRSAEREVYTADLERARAAGATVEVIVDADAAGDFGDVDRMRRVIGFHPERTRLYISGNPAFVGSARRAAIRAGQWRLWQIHTDTFLGY